MFFRPIINLLILMIALQSGMVAADIHDDVFAATQEQQSDSDLHQEKHQQLSEPSHSHDLVDKTACAHFDHSDCSHFVALFQSSGLKFPGYRESSFPFYRTISGNGYSASLYRPPKG